MAKRRIALTPGADQAGFRHAVRMLVAAGVPPEDVVWDVNGTPDLFGAAEGGQSPPVALPRALAVLIEAVVCHRDPERYALLYALIWRTLQGERSLLEILSDPLVHRLQRMRKAVARDLHKMHAFVRFRQWKRRAATSASWPGSSRTITLWRPRRRSLSSASPHWCGPS